MIINHFNLIILYEAPQSPAPISSRTTQFTPPKHILWPIIMTSTGVRIDGHLTKLLRSTLIFFPSPVLMDTDGQNSEVNSNKAFSPFLSFTSPFNFYVVKIDRKHISLLHSLAFHSTQRQETIKNYYFCIAPKAIN